MFLVPVSASPSLNPFIHLGDLELPQPADLVRRHAPVADPTVDSVLTDAQMLGNVLQGHPWLRLHIVQLSILHHCKTERILADLCANDKRKPTDGRAGTMTYENSATPYRVLALDGGGMRGLYTAKLLHILAQRFDEQFTGNVQPDVGHAFHMICGTSTGSILACALAAGIPLGRVMDLYSKEGPVIFPDPSPKTDTRGTIAQLFIRPFWWWVWRQRKTAAGCPSHLQSVLRSMLGNEDLAGVFQRRGIALCIPTVNAVKHHPVVLKTPHIAVPPVFWTGS